MNVLSTELAVSDQQIETAFRSLGCSVDLVGEYAEQDRYTLTHESLADFRQAAGGYREVASIRETTAEGFTALVLTGVQPFRGMQRFDLYVVDFGAARVACRF